MSRREVELKAFKNVKNDNCIVSFGPIDSLFLFTQQQQQ